MIMEKKIFNQEEKEIIRKLYLVDKINPKKIGKIFGCSTTPIFNVFNELGIKRVYPWNKGLNVHSDNRMKILRDKWDKNSESISKKISLSLKGYKETRKKLYLEGKLIPPMLGKHHSEESIKKIKERRALQIAPNVGRKMSEESLKKRTETRMATDGYGAWSKGLNKFTNESIKRMSENKERSKKISEKLKIAYKEGRKIPPSCMKGVVEKQLNTKMRLLREGKIKIWNKGLNKYNNKSLKETSILRMREGNPNWLGGKSFEPYGLDFNQKFRDEIKKRDNHACTLCGISKEKLKRELSIHHIDYNKELSIPANCISLCQKCHSLTNTNRDYWKTFFQSLMSEKYGYKYQDGCVLLEVKNVSYY